MKQPSGGKAKRFRERRMQSKQPTTSTGDANQPHKMVVKMDFKGKKTALTRKRISRGVAKAHKRIKSLQEKNVQLQRKTQTLKKQLQRKSKVKSKSKEKPKSTTQEKSSKTSRSKANSTLRKAGMSPRTVPRIIRKQLIFAQAVSDEVKQALQKGPQKSNTRRGLTASVVSGGGILKKYRCLRFVNKLTGISRDLLSKVNKKLSYSSRRRLPDESKKLTDAMVAFLERGDSRVMPGKDDFVNCNGEKVQKHYLNDYIHNLHSKFRAENPNIRVGKTAFAQRRPKYIIPTSFSSRRTCLCQHHQNMSLKQRALKTLGVQVSTSPDVFIANYKDENAVQELVNKLPAGVNFSHWKRVDEDGKKKMKILAVDIEKEKFGELFRKEVESFRGHAKRVQIQYKQLKILKENLADEEAIVQMDFAENYT